MITFKFANISYNWMKYQPKSEMWGCDLKSGIIRQFRIAQRTKYLWLGWVKEIQFAYVKRNSAAKDAFTEGEERHWTVRWQTRLILSGCYLSDLLL